MHAFVKIGTAIGINNHFDGGFAQHSLWTVFGHVKKVGSKSERCTTDNKTQTFNGAPNFKCP